MFRHEVGGADFTSFEVKNLTKAYGSRGRRSKALDNVSLSLRPGSTVGIVGESGSGKSTLSRLMVGLENPTAGEISLNGSPINRLFSAPDTRMAFRRTVQYVGQDTTTTFDPRRSLRDAVQLPLRRLFGLSEVEAKTHADATVRGMGLDPQILERRPHQVSGGQRQRISIARSLVVRPRLLLCDEVVSALDVSVQGSILNLLKSYCQSTDAAMVFVSHGLPATAFVCDEIAVMYHGQMVEHGPTRQVLGNPRNAYTQRLVEAYRFHRKQPERIEERKAAS